MSLTSSLTGKDGFRHRGHAMSRVDGFSDVVFGFAVTLMVASLEVPKSYDELHEVMLGFIPFATCFTFLMMVWLTHYRFFRRFGLHDLTTIVVNACLLFMVLFYVYPLKFLFTLIGSQFVSIHYQHEPFRTNMQARELMLLYALGFAAIYALLTIMNLHAWRLRKELDLNKLEILILRSEIVDLFGVAFVGILVAITALILPAGGKSFRAGYVFMLIGVWKSISGTYFGRKTRRMQAEMQHGS